MSEAEAEPRLIDPLGLTISWAKKNTWESRAWRAVVETLERYFEISTCLRIVTHLKLAAAHRFGI